MCWIAFIFVLKQKHTNPFVTLELYKKTANNSTLRPLLLFLQAYKFFFNLVLVIHFYWSSDTSLQTSCQEAQEALKIIIVCKKKLRKNIYTRERSIASWIIKLQKSKAAEAVTTAIEQTITEEKHKLAIYLLVYIKEDWAWNYLLIKLLNSIRIMCKVAYIPRKLNYMQDGRARVRLLA